MRYLSLLVCVIAITTGCSKPSTGGNPGGEKRVNESQPAPSQAEIQKVTADVRAAREQLAGVQTKLKAGKLTAEQAEELRQKLLQFEDRLEEFEQRLDSLEADEK